MTRKQKEEIKTVLQSFRNDIEDAENERSKPEQDARKAEAVEAALACLLEALADNQ